MDGLAKTIGTKPVSPFRKENLLEPLRCQSDVKGNETGGGSVGRPSRVSVVTGNDFAFVDVETTRTVGIPQILVRLVYP